LGSSSEKLAQKYIARGFGDAKFYLLKNNKFKHLRE
jgi:hypothetical protein